MSILLYPFLCSAVSPNTGSAISSFGLIRTTISSMIVGAGMYVHYTLHNSLLFAFNTISVVTARACWKPDMGSYSSLHDLSAIFTFLWRRRLSARKGWALGLLQSSLYGFIRSVVVLVEFWKWRVLIGKWILPQHLILNDPYTLRRKTNISFNVVSLYLFVKNMFTSPWDKHICNKIVLCVAAHSNIGSAAARLLGWWLRIPPGAWISVSCECCVLSGRGLFDELITRPEESYLQWSVVVCDPETSRMRRPWPALGRSAEGNACTWTINICVCVCVRRFEGVALLFIALVAVVCCSMQCRSNGCKKEGTFCRHFEGHYSVQKIIICLNSMWRTNTNKPVFMKIN